MTLNVKNLLRKMDYVVTVKENDGGVLVTYPHPKLTLPNVPRLKEYFKPHPEEEGLLAVSSMDGKVQFIPMPRYAIRPFLREEIAYCCGEIGVDGSLVDFPDGVDSIEDMIDPPHDLGKENVLNEVIYKGLNPEDYKVTEGYSVIERFLKEN